MSQHPQGVAGLNQQNQKYNNSGEAPREQDTVLMFNPPQELGSQRIMGNIKVCLKQRKSYDWLVVSIPLKNMNVNWDDYPQHMGKQKSCSSHHQPDINNH